MHQSRQRQATYILSEHANLLAREEPDESSCVTPQVRNSLDPRPWRPGALLGTIAVLLILAHAICAAAIVDRALAHAPEVIAISPSD